MTNQWQPRQPDATTGRFRNHDLTDAYMWLQSIDASRIVSDYTLRNHMQDVLNVLNHSTLYGTVESPQGLNHQHAHVNGQDGLDGRSHELMMRSQYNQGG